MATTFEYDQFHNFDDTRLDVGRYNTRTHELRLYFKNNPQWMNTYYHVPAEVWAELINRENYNPIAVYNSQIKDHNEFLARKDNINDWTPLFVGLPRTANVTQGNYLVRIAFSGYIEVDVRATGISNAENKAQDIAKMTLECLEDDSVNYSYEVVEVKRA